MNIIWAMTSSKTSHNKCKGKKSNIFVNEKMVIKSNHNKSIFKVISNAAFFKHGKKNNDIIVMAKGKPIKTKKKNVKENNENKLNKNNFNEQSENNSNMIKIKKDIIFTKNREEKKIDYVNLDKEKKILI